MELAGRAIALYGKFSPGARDRLQQAIVAAGGAVSRDLTRGSDALIVGALATTLIDTGALAKRLEGAAGRGIPVQGERSFVAELAGEAKDATAMVPLATVLAGTGLRRDDAQIFAAFDLIRVVGDEVRFRDAATFRTAGDLLFRGRSLGSVVAVLVRTRDRSPMGRHRVVVTRSGVEALQWDDGLTTIEGQGVLPLDEDHASLDDLFEAAAIAEAEGDADEAARLYDLCARADRKDPIAPYNLGNIRLEQAAYDAAALAYQQALARDPRFVEARYNLAQALEATGKTNAAATELARVVKSDPGHADAVFNLAQLTMNAGDLGAARALYERYLELNPPEEWATTARKAILYCAAQLPA